MSYFNSGISGTLTGLGILGTFLGLSLGLGSFNGNDIYTISDNVGPLLSGMKVAFHTSVYGIFFSLVFNFVYRSIMADAYEKLDQFLAVFRQCVMPVQSMDEENVTAMLVYQANMANSMKRIQELLSGNAADQVNGVDRIVTQVMKKLQYAMKMDFENLGNAITTAGAAQSGYADVCRNLTETVGKLVETNRWLQDSISKEMDRQVEFAAELNRQKEEQANVLKEISDDVSNQLYTFEQMRNLYEK
jgi:hypothetical protein